MLGLVGLLQGRHDSTLKQFSVVGSCFPCHHYSAPAIFPSAWHGQGHHMEHQGTAVSDVDMDHTDHGAHTGAGSGCGHTEDRQDQGHVHRTQMMGRVRVWTQNTWTGRVKVWTQKHREAVSGCGHGVLRTGRVKVWTRARGQAGQGHAHGAHRQGQDMDTRHSRWARCGPYTQNTDDGQEQGVDTEHTNGQGQGHAHGNTDGQNLGMDGQDQGVDIEHTDGYGQGVDTDPRAPPVLPWACVGKPHSCSQESNT